MNILELRRKNKDLIILLFIWLTCLLIDFYWLAHNESPPAWDQGHHLSNAYAFSNLFESIQLFNSEWWNDLWDITTSYRGPITYIASTPFLKLFGMSFKSAIISNQLFNAILLVSTYNLGKIIYNRESGLWASFFCAISPTFLNQRTDYLIDLSLTSLITLSWFYLGIWRFSIDNNKYFSSFIAGILLGIVFLTRPTGLIFLWIPFILVIRKIIISLGRARWTPFFKLIILIASTFSISWPWFSQNWLTILTSINKARRWGILYQEGLEVNTIEGWLYYPKILPSVFGSFLFGLIIIGIIILLMQGLRNGFHFEKNLSERNDIFWWISFPLGGFIICLFMSTKDIRFAMPLLPQIFIILGIIISLIRKKWSYSWKIFIVIIGFLGALWNQFSFGINLTGLNPNTPNHLDKWPIEEIIYKIRETSPNQLSTLAVLTDSEKLNAFNLDAEGKRQSNLVAARQTYYQSENASDELNNFDWFLLKTGDNGIMSGKREMKISKLLEESNQHSIVKKWKLPDESFAYLYKRDPLSIQVSKLKCIENQPIINLQKIRGGFEIKLSGNASKLINSQLLIDIINGNETYTIDQSTSQGMLRLGTVEKSSCIEITQRFSSKVPSAVLNDSTLLNVRLIDKNGFIQEINTGININSNNLRSSTSINRYDALLEIGNKLREGEFDELFARVGQINQSDPEQIYLKDSEKILIKRLEEEPLNLEYLYALAMAQTLQKKADSASNTFQYIINIDSKNQYVFLSKGFIDLYRFKPKLALRELNYGDKFITDENILDINIALKFTANLMSGDFINAFRMSKKL
tara:strand:- start:41152 stop:43572 length:2421 start_codon:yes stop_codon:yes gene_type:complete